MTTFLPVPAAELADILDHSSEEDVKRALGKSHRSMGDLAALLSPAAEPYLQEMARQSKEITKLRFGKTTQLYGPLYLSNYCTNSCAYCGFSAQNSIKRRKLSLEQAEREAEILKSRGFQHILLVSGEAERHLDVDYLEELARRLKGQFAAVSIEVQPLSLPSYQTLFQAGITGVTIYQETYDKVVYDQVHLAGKKKDYGFRLDTPSRAAAAGMREVGIGTLLGLADWRVDGLALGYHLAWLRKKYWQTGFTVSFPRLRPAAGAFSPNYVVEEQNLCQLIFGLRLFDHDLGLTLSTREQVSFRNGMLGLGPTRYSAGSCTTPGGYADPSLEGEQFAVGDQRSLEEMSAYIHSRGYDPVFKDWDNSFQMH